MIEINNLTLNFSKNFRLDIKSLHIKDKEILSIIGPNGAGKTTLLNILSLFEKPESGKIIIFDKNILEQNDVLSYRRRISYVFSRPYLLNNTVKNNIAVPLRLRGENSESKVNE